MRHAIDTSLRSRCKSWLPDRSEPKTCYKTGCKTAVLLIQSVIEASESSSSQVYMLRGYRKVSALGLGLTSTTLLSGVQCEVASDVVDVVYCLKPFATMPAMSLSES